jgi:hypothetical protein
MLTIAILAALGQEEELKLHFRATRNTGVSRDEVKEILMHLAVYAGVPAANTAFRIARRELDAMAAGRPQGTGNDNKRGRAARWRHVLRPRSRLAPAGADPGL